MLVKLRPNLDLSMASYFSLKPFTIFFFIFITFTTFFLPSHCDDAENFTQCGIPYECGDFKNVNFPFWGGSRPQFCGFRNFYLECKKDHSFIHINELEFRILKLDQSNEENKMTIAMSNSCSTPVSPKTTLDFQRFKFNPNEFTNLTLIYNCSEPFRKLIFFPPKFLFCGSQEVYYAEDIQIEGLRPHLNQACRTVQIPVSRDTLENIKSGKIVKVEEALRKGFEVEYHAPAMEHWGACLGSGGRCGSNTTTNSFVCYCRDHLGDQGTCPPTHHEKRNWGLKAGIGVGAACFAVILMCIGFFFYQRNYKKRNAQSTFFRNISSDISSVKDVEKGGSTYLGVHVFTYEELVEATNNFDPSKELGDGGFGTVYYGKLQDGRRVAVKRLYENNFRRVEQFMNEVEILAHVRHPNLVQLYGCTSRHSRELLLVYEYISNGTVADHLHGEKAKPGALPWAIRLNIAVESSRALTYLHATDIIHRDVKTNNILLDNNFSVKVADFGLSRLFPNHVTHISTAPQGTPGYVDPEYHHCYQLTSKSDVFSFGVVLVELISSMPAVDITRHRHDINLSTMAINRIQNHAMHEIVDPSLGFDSDSTVRKMITAVAELAFQCLQNEKDMRPSMNDVLEELKAIQSRDYSPETAEKKDVVTDEAVLLKNGPLTLSPDSVTANWVSRNTTPNASG